MATIDQIYQEYQIPKNLQRHMLRVASVGDYLQNASQEPLDRNSVLSALLLHDMANILKFELEKSMEMFDPPERDYDYWKQVKNNFIAKYGANLHQATKKISQEIGVSPRVIQLIENLGSSKLAGTVNSDDCEQKIVTYSDFRVGPQGFLSINDRFDDIIDRYKDRWPSPQDLAYAQQIRQDCLILESQLETKLSVSLKDLPKETLEKESQNLLKFEIN